jgi:hypothetical protein
VEITLEDRVRFRRNAVCISSPNTFIYKFHEASPTQVKVVRAN